MVDLTFQEGARLIRVLRVAFPSRLALKQVVFVYLSQDLDAIAEDDTYVGTLVRLIDWAESENQTAALIDGARKVNPGNDWLREFEASYHHARPAAPGISQPLARVLTQASRAKLVDAIQQLQIAQSYEGRNNFLLGIPSSLNRFQNNAQADLDAIVDQLDGLGRMTTGDWPLLVFIDNAKRYAAGFEAETVLQTIRQNLAQTYGVP